MKKLFSVILIAVLVLFNFASCDKGVLYTESIEDYNTEKYPIKNTIFLETIPDGATVISFAYYRYWGESRETHLELQFRTVSDLEEYINFIKSHAESYLIDCKKPSDGEWFVEVENPYNENYVDLVVLDFPSSQNGKHYVGYSIEKKDSIDSGHKYTQYVCNYRIISYSLEDLTVIQSSAQGYFQYFEEAYVPKYFTRFNIPTDEEFERIYYVEY